MKKSYKWIVAFLISVVACFAGNALKPEKNIKNHLPADTVNLDAEKLLEANDENREEYVVKINLNKATKDELCLVPGIGESTADEILKVRNHYGSFVSVEEIKMADGIGDKTFEKIKKYLTVE